MKSIKELRTICQDSKIKSKDKLGFSYDDLKSKFLLFCSIYFTWIFLRLRVSGNQVTIISGIVVIFSCICLTSQSLLINLLAGLLLILFDILDFSDGEVSRYNKTNSISGWFLDWLMHYIRDGSLFLGLTLGVYFQYQEYRVLILGLIAFCSVLLLKIIIGCVWTVICWSKLSGNKVEYFEKDKYVFSNNVLFKLIGIVFQHHWNALILPIVIIGQLIVNQLDFISLDLKLILLVYAGFVGPFVVIVNVVDIMRGNICNEKFKILFSNDNSLGNLKHFF